VQLDPLPPPAVPAPLEAPIAAISGDTLAWTLTPLTEFAAALGVSVHWQPLPQGTDGRYEPKTRRITVSTAVAVNQQAAALVHEYAERRVMPTTATDAGCRGLVATGLSA